MKFFSDSADVTSLASCFLQADRVSLKEILEGRDVTPTKQTEWMFSLASKMSAEEQREFAIALENAPLPVGGQGGGGGGGAGGAGGGLLLGGDDEYHTMLKKDGMPARFANELVPEPDPS